MRIPPTALKVCAVALWLSVGLSGQAPLASLSDDLQVMLLSGSTQTVRAIIRGDVATIQSVAARDGLPVLRVLDGMVVVQTTLAEISALRQVDGIKGISRDAIVAPFMTVSTKAMAADQARAAEAGLLGLGGYPAVSGKGVGVAVIDSGIATSHAALAGKVVGGVSFVTGDSSTSDGFGHGTHIAGIIAGLDTGTTTLYQGGIAPGAHLINVRVLNNAGAGYTSDVIAGIQWTVANRGKYAIRVINLSLGHTQVEPCLVDPLCLATENASAAGLIVVVSAGNNGKNAAGQEVLASITTPGASPSAITVGALNTRGTVTPDDDTITTYSSRGPTKYELGLKPDVVAPGNKIVSLEAPGSYLTRKYPALHVTGSKYNSYYSMSGTSMAAAMVSGGAALLLEGTTLTSRQVKVALQLSATFMTDAGLLRAGLGRVNLYSARRVNTAVTSQAGSIPPVTIAGRTVQPSGLMTSNSRPLLDGALAPVGTSGVGSVGLLASWLDRVLNPARVTALRGSQMIWGDQIGTQQMIWGDQTPFGQQMIWGDHSPYAQQMIWGDQTLGQQMIWGDQTLGQQMIWGDQTAGQQMIWGDADMSNANQMIWGDSTVPDGQ